MLEHQFIWPNPWLF